MRTGSSREPARRGGIALSRLGLFATVFITGACALSLEILSARVLAPVFGNALHVWASLITVTLGFLAIGYGIGGIAADRRPVPAMGIALAAAAAATLLLGWLRAPVLKLSLGGGFVGGALLAATLLFALPMTCLGMIVPIAVRIGAGAFDRVGRTAGGLFAISTVGSVAGALLTGFELAPNFAVSTLLDAVAAVLLLLSVPWLVAARVSGLAAGVAILVALSVFSHRRAAGEPRFSTTWTRTYDEDGRTVTAESRLDLVWSGPSRYGDVRVVDDHAPKLSNRILFLDGTPQTVIQIDRERSEPLYSVMDYTYGLRLAQVLHPDAASALVIGVGGAGLCRILDEKGVTVDLAEIDPEVTRIAKRYFGLRESLPVVTLDGAEALRRATKLYDLLFIDAYHANDIPVHLVLPEFFALAASRLAPRGILALNCMTSTGPSGERIWRAVARSAGSALPNLEVFVLAGGETANYLLFGSASPLPDASEAMKRWGVHDPALERARMPRPEWDSFMEAAMAKLERVPFDGAGLLLSADYNPLPEWQLPASLAIRKSVLASFPQELLIRP